jgi:hypothetical protein
MTMSRRFSLRFMPPAFAATSTSGSRLARSRRRIARRWPQAVLALLPVTMGALGLGYLLWLTLAPL